MPVAVITDRYKFTGKERDSESGLDNFGARYNASSLGRFMTPDWAAKPTTVPYAKFGDPQSLNLYSYVENGPLDRIDRDGHILSSSEGVADGTAGSDGGSYSWDGGNQAATHETTGQAQNQVSAPPAVQGTLTINTISTGDPSFTDGHAVDYFHTRRRDHDDVRYLWKFKRSAGRPRCECQ